MSGIYGSHPEDRARERELNAYLDSTAVAPERHAKAVARAMAKLLKTDPHNPADGGGLVAEAMSEEYQRLDRPIADLLRSALENAESVASASFDDAAIGRICRTVIVDYLRGLADEEVDAELDEMDANDRADAEDAAYEDHKQRQLDAAA